MKTAIKLILLYFVFQLVGAVLGRGYGFLYALIKGFPLTDEQLVAEASLVPALLIGFLLMTIYLWKAGYISMDKANWSPVSVPYLLLTVVAFAAASLLVDYVNSLFDFLPDIVGSAFDILQAGWLGIVCLVVIGPVVEELMFRGAITKALLNRYAPAKAIILSALIFGIIHINPAQIVTAILMGLLLAWIYYKSASLVPCILIHILNNGLSVYLSLKYPHVETVRGVIPDTGVYYGVLGAAAVVLVGVIWCLTNGLKGKDTKE